MEPPPTEPSGFRIDIPSGTLAPRHAVVAEADPVLRAALAGALRRRGFTVAAADGAMAALTLMGETDTGLALLCRRDGTAPDSGERAAALAVALYPRTRILLTAVPADDAAADAAPAGGDPFLTLSLTADAARLAVRLDRCLMRLDALAA